MTWVRQIPLPECDNNHNWPFVSLTGRTSDSLNFVSQLHAAHGGGPIALKCDSEFKRHEPHHEQTGNALEIMILDMYISHGGFSQKETSHNNQSHHFTTLT